MRRLPGIFVLLYTQIANLWWSLGVGGLYKDIVLCYVVMRLYCNASITLHYNVLYCVTTVLQL